MRNGWGRMPLQITGLMVTPDSARLVAAGLYDMLFGQLGSIPQDCGAPAGGGPEGQGTGASANKSQSETRIIIYDLNTGQPETCVSVSSRVRHTRLA